MVRRAVPRMALACVALSLLAAGCGNETAPRVQQAPIARAVAAVVLDGASQPVPAVNVVATPADATIGFKLATTDAAGVARFTLAEGRWTLYARVATGVGLSQVSGSVGRVLGTEIPAADTVLFRLPLVTESIARGTVQIAGRTDHSGTDVLSVDLPLRVTTDVNGAWTLGGLPPGAWTTTAGHFGFRTAVFDVTVPAPDDTVSVAGPIVLQPGGTPAPRR